MIAVESAFKVRITSKRIAFIHLQFRGAGFMRPSATVCGGAGERLGRGSGSDEGQSRTATK